MRASSSVAGSSNTSSPQRLPPGAATASAAHTTPRLSRTTKGQSQNDSTQYAFHTASRKSRPELHWKYIVQSEIVSVTNALKKSQRWGFPSSSSERKSPHGDPNAPVFTPTYDFCVDNARYGHVSLDGVLEFTKMQGKNAKQELAGYEMIHENTPLLQGFSFLRARLTLLHELRDLDPALLLEPFLEVIRSPDTTGPITGAALTSVEKFITYRVLDPNHPGLPAAIAALTDAVVRCRFEATDTVADEAVLAKILALLRVILTSDTGQKCLHDKGICEMVEVAFGMIFQGRVNELLRRSAEQTLVVLVQALFERLSAIVKAKEHEANFHHTRTRSTGLDREPHLTHNRRASFVAPGILRRGSRADLQDGSGHASSSQAVDTTSPSIQMFDEPDEGAPRDVSVISVGGSPGKNANVERTGADADGPRIGVSRNERIMADGGMRVVRHDSGVARPVNDNAAPADESRSAGKQPEHPSSTSPSSSSHPASPARSAAPPPQYLQPFGLPSILEMLRVLITLLDPKNRMHTDSMHRTISLGLLHAGLEVGGRSLGKLISWELHRVDSKPAPAQQAPSTLPSTQIPTVGAAPEGSGAADTGSSAGPDTSAGATGAEGGPAERGSVATPEPGLTDPDAETWEEAEDRTILMARDLVTNDLCKYLFQLLQNNALATNATPSATTTRILSLSLSCITTLFQSAPQQLKLQQEWYLNWAMERLNVGIASWDIEEWERKRPDRPDDFRQSAASAAGQAAQRRELPIGGEARDLILESLSQLCHVPSFAVELYVNYDCAMDRPVDLHEDLVKLLAKHSLPDLTPGGPVTHTSQQGICFDALLALLQHMVERKGFSQPHRPSAPSVPAPDDTPTNDLSPERLRYNKERKRVLMEGSKRFNDDPRKGIAFLQEHQFLPDPVTPDSLAKFLKATPSINKVVLGDYLAKPKNLDLLKAFVGLMDFADKSFDDAMRTLLESFRLPGEAQQIERVMETFANAYFDADKKTGHQDLENVNAVFILAFAVVMLNTDMYSKNVRAKMTLEQFGRNLRGLNGGKDFAPEYLARIYNAIKENEIVFPEEHAGDLGFNYQYRELIKKSAEAGPLISCHTNVYDKDMFLSVWNAFLASLSYAFDNAEDELTLQKAIVGYHHCSILAAYYGNFEILDNVIVALSKMTGLLKETQRLPAPRTKVGGEAQDASRGSVDPWSVEIGRNFRGQIAAVLMFSLVDEYGTSLKKGWRWVIACVRNMFLHNLLPDSLIQAEDFIKGTILIPRVADAGAVQRAAAANARREAGLFSTLSNFLSLGSNTGDEWDDYEPMPGDMEWQERAIRCVAACKIDVMLADTRFLEEDTLRFLIDALVQASIAPENGVPGQLKANGSQQQRPPNDDGSTGPPSTPQTTVEQPLKYDTAVVFLLEVIVSIAMHNRDRISVVWPMIANHFRKILQHANEHPPVLVERAVMHLLRLIGRTGHKDEMLHQLVDAFTPLKTMSQDSFNAFAEQFMTGLVTILKSDPTIITRNTRWTLFLDLLARASMHPDASRPSFEAVCILLSDHVDSCVNQDNFGDWVDLLIGYAAAAGQGGGATSPVGGSANLSARALVNGTGGSGSGPSSPRLGRESTAFRSQIISQAHEQALRALEELYRLHTRIPVLVEKTGMNRNRAFFEFWLPVLSGLSQQSSHPALQVRVCALTFLQRGLLSPQLESACSGGTDGVSQNLWAECFENVLFPMLDELLRPEMQKLDPMEMDVTRMRASALLCKVFLLSVPKLQMWRDFPTLWGRILDFMRRYMEAGTSDYLREGVQESLKNMLLVMSTLGVLYPPAADAPQNQPNLWDPTWRYIGTFLPDLQSELFPPPTAPLQGDARVPQQPQVEGHQQQLASLPAQQTYPEVQTQHQQEYQQHQEASATHDEHHQQPAHHPYQQLQYQQSSATDALANIAAKAEALAGANETAP
ncbi:uncharacterized protein EV422DRAFT_618537 [Fimicolochytrium jonesii]|uniref:uncharacterized protein n=1 Tax=Fimicolochytrium jonesii TaxID=1396493 RepID=UPI0022FEC11D|nr:uncharacterized protein EV422DRAFT_618537 [Fimicolochytrium jonesii]KAI8823734.1 hypothetical protein EV422DRAFT_618537 [Fimicolochytrium jonesii]